MELTSSCENYLKTIYIVKREHGTVRSIDIANYMGISKPSVCAAVKQLQAQGCITKNEAGMIELTDRGKSEAEMIFERHCFFERTLIDAGVSPEQAHMDAGRLEHAVSEESFEALKRAGECGWRECIAGAAPLTADR